MNIVLSIDLLISVHANGSVNRVRGDLLIDNRVFHPQWSAEQILKTISEVTDDVYLYSTFTKDVTKRLRQLLPGEWKKAPIILVSCESQLGIDHKRRDILLEKKLLAMGLDLSRSVVLDENFCVFRSLDDMHKEEASLKLAKNRIPGLYSRLPTNFGLHLRLLMSKRGDLRRRDKTFYFEDYQAEERGQLLELAASMAIPDTWRARKKGERILALDLDETLIHTDLYRSRGPEEPPYDYMLGSSFGGWIRPGLIDFLKTANRLFNRVCIYTAASRVYAENIIEQVIPAELSFDFIVTREDGLQIRESDQRSKSVLFLEALGYDPSRVAMIDDRLDVYYQSRKNVFTVTPFYGGGGDRLLENLKAYLPVLSKTKDVRNLKRRNFYG